MKSGILILDKPYGISSAKAVHQAKRLFHFKKAGHTGCLDPLATGLLPICFGEATKFSSYLLAANKIYYAVAKLGIKTSTADSEGEVIQKRAVPALNFNQLRAVADTFTGEITQIPSMFSALKYQGKPLYQLARQGITVERKERKVKITSIVIEHYQDDELSITVSCSKGTYIRNLVEDMGEALGCGAHLKTLRRLGIGSFEAAQGVDLNTLSALSLEERAGFLHPISSMLEDYPALTLNQQETEALLQGKRISIANHSILSICLNETAALAQLIDPEGNFFGMGLVEASGHLHPHRMMATKEEER